MANGYLFLLITNELAQETLDSIPFPIKLSIPKSIKSDDVSLGEAGIEVTENPNPYSDSARNNRGSDFDEHVKTAILLRNGKTLADDEDIEIFNAYKVDVDDPSPGTDTQKARGRLKRALLRPFKKIIAIELVWIKLEVDKPDVVLGDPILIQDMTVRIQVRFRACMKIFGKKFSKTVTTDMHTLEARQLKLELQTKGAKICVLPSFTDLDVLLDFSMYGFTFTSQPGITTIVNKQLHKRGAVEIIDLSTFEKDVPFSRSKLMVSSIAFAPDPKGLVINMVMSVI